MQDRKDQIAAAFGRAARGYENAAMPQRRTAALVAELACRLPLSPNGRILEIGCGTGILTRAIRACWPVADLVVTDLSPAMVGAAAQGGMLAGTFVPMDGEKPAFDGPWFDLVVSSLAFQWFADLPGALHRLVGLLRPGGTLLFATMGADSFKEWRAAHAAAGTISGTPAYPRLADLVTMLAPWPDSFAFDEHWPFDFGGARGLLGHLRGVGATVPADGHDPLPAARLKAVMNAFDAGGGKVSYHVLVGRVTI